LNSCSKGLELIHSFLRTILKSMAEVTFWNLWTTNLDPHLINFLWPHEKGERIFQFNFS
jgi:hypothetical protein